MYEIRYFNDLLRKAREIKDGRLYISVLIDEENMPELSQHILSPQEVVFDDYFFEELGDETADAARERGCRVFSLLRSEIEREGMSDVKLGGAVGVFIKQELDDNVLIYYQLMRVIKKIIVEKPSLVSVLAVSERPYSYDPWETKYSCKKGRRYREVACGIKIDIVHCLKNVRNVVLAKEVLREDGDDFRALSQLVDKDALPEGSRGFLQTIGGRLICEMQDRYEELLKEYYEKYHLVTVFSDGEEERSAYADSLALFRDAAEAYCFADCTDQTVKEIVCEGKRVFYLGWQPGMLYEFVDESGKTVFSSCFPEWDH